MSESQQGEILAGTPSTMPELVPFFKAFCSSTRARIIELLLSGERCVCEITPVIGGSQPLISHHLAILRGTGFVQMREEGARAYYRIDDARLDELMGAFGSAVRQARANQTPVIGCGPFEDGAVDETSDSTNKER